MSLLLSVPKLNKKVLLYGVVYTWNPSTQEATQERALLGAQSALPKARQNQMETTNLEKTKQENNTFLIGLVGNAGSW